MRSGAGSVMARRLLARHPGRGEGLLGAHVAVGQLHQGLELAVELLLHDHRVAVDGHVEVPSSTRRSASARSASGRGS